MPIPGTEILLQCVTELVDVLRMTRDLAPRQALAAAVQKAGDCRGPQAHSEESHRLGRASSATADGCDGSREWTGNVCAASRAGACDEIPGWERRREYQAG